MRYLILFLLLAATSYCAAQKTASKPTVERIEDPAPTKVKLLTDADDDLLPVKSAGSGSTRPSPGKSTVKDPATKAGNPATIRLKDVFQFDLVVGYSALIPGESLITSYFFLDSKQGHCGLDKGAVSSMANASAEADGNSLDFLLHSYQGGQYYFMTSADKGKRKLVMTMNTGNTSMNVDMDAWLDGTSFEETFRLTGQKRKIGKNLSGSPYVSEEYIGKSPIDGSTLRIWMADPDFNTGFYAATYMGLGVISLPRAKKQRLITRIEGGGAVWEVSYLQRQRNQFSGAAYQPVNLAMADELKEARANLQKQVAGNDAGEETDPVMKQLKQQQAATTQQMAGKVDVALQQMQQSADLSQWQQQMNQALGEMDIAGMQLNQLKQEQRELELQLRDARKENDKTAINTLNCQLQCNQRAQTLMISIDKRKKEIITKYPGEKNAEKRSTLEAELYQQMVKQLSVPCNCD